MIRRLVYFLGVTLIAFVGGLLAELVSPWLLIPVLVLAFLYGALLGGWEGD